MSSVNRRTALSGPISPARRDRRPAGRTALALSCAVVVTALATGCGSGQDTTTPERNADAQAADDGTERSGKKDTSSSKEQNREEAGTEPDRRKPSPTPTPSPNPVVAADDTDYQACEDGTCEVSVPEPVRIPVSNGDIEILRVKSDRLKFDLTFDGGGGGRGTMTDCGGIYRFYEYGGTSGEFCRTDGRPLPSPKPEPGALALQVVAGPDDTPVLRVVSGS